MPFQNKNRYSNKGKQEKKPQSEYDNTNKVVLWLNKTQDGKPYLGGRVNVEGKEAAIFIHLSSPKDGKADTESLREDILEALEMFQERQEKSTIMFGNVVL